MAQAPPTTVREAGTSTPTRRSVGRRLSATHVLIAVVVILAFVLNFLVLQDRSDSVLVAVADEAIPAGSVLDESSVTLVAVDADFVGLDALVSEDELAAQLGSVFTRSVPAGAPLALDSLTLADATNALRTMSIPVSIAHASGGSLVAGDLVDVIRVVDEAAVYVVQGLEVVAVADPEAGSIGASGGYHIVVAVDQEGALRLAEAIDAGSLELVETTGVRGTTDAP